jgi:hypothetical protein
MIMDPPGGGLPPAEAIYPGTVPIPQRHHMIIRFGNGENDCGNPLWKDLNPIAAEARFSDYIAFGERGIGSPMTALAGDTHLPRSSPPPR